MKFYINKEDGKGRKRETHIELPAQFIMAIATATGTLITILLNL
ncbi:hypothetical protein [Alkalihalobacillus pseudalcaliphilus]|nr:hypothetical protein [Alkalihalobacillus pseudalcaliphilus]